MPDQYIEIEWNGVRTRVPVMGTIGVAVTALPLKDIPPGFLIWQASPPDADSEYDRDVRGE